MTQNNKKKLESPVRRISRVLNALVEHRQKKLERREVKKDFRHMTRPMRRKATPDLEKVKRNLTRLIAYDLETTSIEKGTPKPLYITACGGGGFWISGAITGISQLSEILVARFLTAETQGARFVAWNGNKFDVYFVAMALLKNPDYILRPYLTSGKSLRGLRVIRRTYNDAGLETTGQKGADKIEWEFLDGIAVTGIPKSLKDFLKTFAPDFQKLGGPDFDKETFDSKNPEHVRYAERDSEGLYHAMEKARSVCVDNFSIDLSATVGNMAIKIFQRHIPKMIECWKPPAKAARAIRDTVMRGGFVYCVGKHEGPVWKYDINQAYAAAMRDAKLPAGRCVWSQKRNPYAASYIARITAVNEVNRIPFYYRDLDLGKTVFALKEIGDTWLTSIEIEQLEKEGWKVNIAETWFWSGKFSMKEYVDKLETLRIGTPDFPRDPKDAQGEMMKYVGNNSYGKTVERLDGLELVMAPEQPEGYAEYPVDDETESDALKYIWYRFSTPILREYHQPQIGAFITAHVRMVVRRVALLNPAAWLYADTDCVMFSESVALDIDPGKYGAWKLEESGTEYWICAKKVYCSIDQKTKHAKGMNIRYLTGDDFKKWHEGKPPRQNQTQRNNFVKVLSGFDMFASRVKWGQVNTWTKKQDALRAA